MVLKRSIVFVRSRACLVGAFPIDATMSCPDHNFSAGWTTIPPRLWPLMFLVPRLVVQLSKEVIAVDETISLMEIIRAWVWRHVDDTEINEIKRHIPEADLQEFERALSQFENLLRDHSYRELVELLRARLHHLLGSPR